MATDSQTAPLSAPRGPAPLAPSVRHRVTKTFEQIGNRVVATGPGTLQDRVVSEVTTLQRLVKERGLQFD